MRFGQANKRRTRERRKIIEIKMKRDKERKGKAREGRG